MSTVRGMIGILLTDRDAHLINKVFSSLDTALAHFLEQYKIPVDLVVSLRHEDSIAANTVQKHAPKNARSTRLLFCDYEADWKLNFHTDTNLQAICMQRNLMMSCARTGSYSFLMFLDSDIYVKQDTISRLYDCSNSTDPVIVVPYQPRWAAHVTVAIRQPEKDARRYDEMQLQFLLNPELLQPGDPVQVAVCGLGCSIIRPSAYDIEFVIETVCGVKGEDIGFCESLRQACISLKMIPGYCVDHEAGGKAVHLFIPHVDGSRPLLTHVKVSQMSWMETGSPFQWVVSSRRPETEDTENVVWAEQLVPNYS